MLATFDEVAAFVAQRVAAAAAAAGGAPRERLVALLTAYYDLLREEPASARVFLSEMVGIDPRVDALFAQTMVGFADLIARTLVPGHDGIAIEPLRRAGAMHGLLAVARDWVARGCAEPVAAVVRIAEPLCRVLVDDASPTA